MNIAAALAVLAETEEPGNVALETLPYGIVAAVVFAALGLVTFSFRNVANRHADKVARAASHEGHGH
ncbi:hypothetical protein ACWDR7_06970 [Microbacterium sp. NPDC003461]|jgi:hypothetical protein